MWFPFPTKSHARLASYLVVQKGGPKLLARVAPTAPGHFLLLLRLSLPSLQHTSLQCPSDHAGFPASSGRHSAVTSQSDKLSARKSGPPQGPGKMSHGLKTRILVGNAGFQNTGPSNMSRQLPRVDSPRVFLQARPRASYGQHSTQPHPEARYSPGGCREVIHCEGPSSAISYLEK